MMARRTCRLFAVARDTVAVEVGGHGGSVDAELDGELADGGTGPVGLDEVRRLWRTSGQGTEDDVRIPRQAAGPATRKQCDADSRQLAAEPSGTRRGRLRPGPYVDGLRDPVGELDEVNKLTQLMWAEEEVLGVEGGWKHQPEEEILGVERVEVQ